MCGISGIYHLDNKPVHPEKICRMTNLIHHRGPDDEGYIFLNTRSGKYCHCYGDDTLSVLKSQLLPLKNEIGANLAFGFRRLSILDLTEKGHQPMSSNDGTIWIVFNGEVYNYIEIRNELIQLGYTFKSGTDTEVIINAYLHWGTACLKRFNGMWSFALWDNTKKILFCARDRFGIKPFNYYFDGKVFLFGSEVKQIISQDIDKKTDESVIYKSFAIGAFTINSDNTYFKNVKILPHSHFLIIKNNKLDIQRYYDLNPLNFEKSRLSFTDACKRYRELFTDAVKLRMRSDVEVGSTLSGGLDSSAIVTVASGFTERQFKTFSSYYTYSPQFDERKWINLVVEKTGSKAHYISASPEQVWSDLEKIVWHHDYPLESSSPVAQFYVMELSKKNNVTVLLDGQGSDELTSGYNHGFYRYYADLLSSMSFLRFFKEFPDYLKHNQKGNFIQKKYKILASFLFNEKTLYNLELKTSFNPLRKPPESIELNEIKQLRTSRLSNFLYNQMMSTSIQTLLHFEDRNSMAHSIESRVPFLDYRLAELVFSLPSYYKINGNYGKYIHREALKAIVPRDILNRKDKIGFLSPGEGVWLRNEYKPLVAEIFNSPDFKNRDIYNHKLIKKIYSQYLKGDYRYGKKIWQLLMLELWFRTFKS
ncbi:MAG: asparagine synthase (glutamine-hydrolyzing) [Candidatus Atribacteria bacterium]|nr:asparagine synthase (glutamine-hydrolyzing) [Candidatus Atribacteria bacterium]